MEQRLNLVSLIMDTVCVPRSQATCEGEGGGIYIKWPHTGLQEKQRKHNNFYKILMYAQPHILIA